MYRLERQGKTTAVVPYTPRHERRPTTGRRRPDLASV
jgi:hypothetical protein